MSEASKTSNGPKAVINLGTGLGDPERVLTAFLVGHAAAEQGNDTLMFLTKEAVRLAIPGMAVGTACEGCPPLERLFDQYAQAGGKFLVCPICWNSRRLQESPLVGNAEIGGATPLWKWIGEGATVFSF
jgi:predicted peroxiredoxin